MPTYLLMGLAYTTAFILYKRDSDLEAYFSDTGFIGIIFTLAVGSVIWAPAALIASFRGDKNDL